MTGKKNYFEDELLPDEAQDPLEDTRPTGIFPQVDVKRGNPIIGLFLIVMAISLTVCTVVMLLTPPVDAPVVAVTDTPNQVVQTTDAVVATTVIPTTPPDRWSLLL